MRQLTAPPIAFSSSVSPLCFWRRQSAVIVASTALVLIGCAPRNKAYPGPVRDSSEIAVVQPGAEKEFQSRYIAILAINGREKIEDWVGGADTAVHLIPGEYRFRVEYKQFTPPTMILIIDLVMMINDAVVAFQHGENTISFPVTAGFTYSIHCIDKEHMFFIARKEHGGVTKMPPILPPPDAVLCLEQPDRTAELWCQLIPDNE